MECNYYCNRIRDLIVKYDLEVTYLLNNGVQGFNGFCRIKAAAKLFEAREVLTDKPDFMGFCRMRRGIGGADGVADFP